MATRAAIPSAYNTILSNRSIGYSMSSAVADIIDNSISADAKNIYLHAPNSNDPILLIVDDGTGMNQEELDAAMTFGGIVSCQEKRSKIDLGRFGMGLKTASLSQCTKLEVITKKDGNIIGGCWDISYIKKNDSWNYLVIPENECIDKISKTVLADPEQLNGTAVIWSHFDRLKDSASNKMDEFALQMNKTCDKLELIFHRYLIGETDINKVSIYYNGNKLHANDPFLTSECATIAKPQRIAWDNEEIFVQCHKLPHPEKLKKTQLQRLQLGETLLETQGFYVYRNKRLIDYGTWFGLASKQDKTKLSRIQIDIPNTLDSVWSLDIKKSRVIPPEKIRGDLRTILETNAIRSQKTYTTRTKKKKSGTYWVREITPENTAEYSINDEHPLLKSFRETLTADKQKEFDLIIKNLAKFFPFSRLELDQQADTIIENENDKFQQPGMKEDIELMIASGFTAEDILKTYPGWEDFVKSILEEYKVNL